MERKTAIVGGGAAGFFAAINLKEMVPDMDVTIFEGGSRVLKKVEISGGGRCNCTNTFAEVGDLKHAYPRGHRLMKRLFNIFDQHDAYSWMERHGVELTVQDDQCVFPKSQDSHTIINMFLAQAAKHGIHIRTSHRITSLSELSGFDFIVITTGGQPRQQGLAWLEHPTVSPVPSLFTFSIGDASLHELMGTVVEHASVMIPGTSMRSQGELLITHWGMSGPAILRLSSYAARLLADNDYCMPLCVNWTGSDEAHVGEALRELTVSHAQKQVTTARPFMLPSRLWAYLAGKCIGERSLCRWKELSRKELNKLCSMLTGDTYQIKSRATFKDEFVTCGGVALQAVNATTLESKTRKHLYFAGEVLDIDGITGGFNFQAAWTTSYAVACAIRDEAAAARPSI